ncbi:MAG: hypothetical protein PVJ76_17785, partial [Gemmatimonadota bacterium]
YYYERRRWFFGMFILASGVAVGDLFLKGQSPNLIFAAVYSAFFVVGMVTQNAKFHGAFALLHLFGGIASLFREGWDIWISG